jgi:hypothetical protein
MLIFSIEEKKLNGHPNFSSWQPTSQYDLCEDFTGQSLHDNQAKFILFWDTMWPKLTLEGEILLPQSPECWDYKCVDTMLSSKNLHFSKGG